MSLSEAFISSLRIERNPVRVFVAPVGAETKILFLL